MSVNLDISFEVHNIEHIHQLDDEDKKRNEVIAAANQFLKEEGLSLEEMGVDFLGQKGYLAAYSYAPLIISRSYVWLPEVTKRWEEMAYRVLGKDCVPKVEVEYPDEED